MKQANDLARVILLPDGSVHIAFQDIRSIHATPENLLQLFADPLDFINTKSKTYKTTTKETNENRVPLFEVLGLTLASISADKQVVCDFPELFQYILTANDDKESRTQSLNMRAIENQHFLADEKSFLLRHYLEFTNRLTSTPQLQTRLQLREEAQTEIIRETLNIYLSRSFPDAPAAPDVSERIAVATSEVASSDKDTDKKNYVDITTYGCKYGYSRATIYNCLKDGRIKDFYKLGNGQYRINITKPPIVKESATPRKVSPKKRVKNQTIHTESAEEVAKYILENDLFSARIAPFIHTFAELNYYLNHGYREVFWNNRPALIIDINPEYVGPSGKSNRQLIADEESPFPPYKYKDDKPFEIHHVGQHEKSPFAIVPPYDHTGKGGKEVFHPGAPNGDLHGPLFERQKKQFWERYIVEYDKAGRRFDHIPHLDKKTKKKKK